MALRTGPLARARAPAGSLRPTDSSVPLMSFFCAIYQHRTPRRLPGQRRRQETRIDMAETAKSLTHHSHPAMSDAEQRLLNKAKQTIQQKLADPELNRTAVAKALKKSVRRLNEVFAREGTSLSVYIRTCRLERISADLQDVRFSSLSISAIGRRWGVRNFQQFSRVFRRYHGVSARDYRNGLRASQMASSIGK